MYSPGVIALLMCPHYYSKDAVQKPKYFVCTKAGFLHSLDSKFDSLPRESYGSLKALCSIKALLRFY